jgi:hypothetical protein
LGNKEGPGLERTSVAAYFYFDHLEQHRTPRIIAKPKANTLAKLKLSYNIKSKNLPSTGVQFCFCVYTTKTLQKQKQNFAHY